MVGPATGFTRGTSMIATHENRIQIPENQPGHLTADESAPFRFTSWPVCWSAIHIGALAAIAAILILGLIGTTLGIHLVGAENRVVDLRKVGLVAIAFSVFGAFLAYVCGGWVAGKIGAFRRSEPAMLHGAISWLVTVPVLIVLASLGAGSYLGGWHGALSGSPSWASHTAAPFDRPEPVDASATPAERAQYQADRAEYVAKVKQWREETPRATRNAALGAVTALLLGLMGSVIGGWMASGEPMTLTHCRTRDTLPH
jgi:hypothetical protein